MKSDAKKRSLKNINKKISKGETLSEIEGNIFFFNWIEKLKPEDPYAIIIKYKEVRKILLLQLNKYGIPGVAVSLNRLLGLYWEEKSKKAVKAVWAKMFNSREKSIELNKEGFIKFLEDILRYRELTPFLAKTHFLSKLAKTNKKAREKVTNTIIEELGLVLRVFKSLDSNGVKKPRVMYKY